MLYHFLQGDSSQRTVNALDLMRTLDSESEDNTEPEQITKTSLSKKSLETVPENETELKVTVTHKEASSHIKKVPSKRKRAQSSSALMTGSSNSKHLSPNPPSGRNSTSGHTHSQSCGNCSSSASRLRSMSVGAAKTNGLGSKRPGSAGNKHNNSSHSKFKA